MLYPAYIIDLIDTSFIVQVSMYESIDCGIMMKQVHVGNKTEFKEAAKNSFVWY